MADMKGRGLPFYPACRADGGIGPSRMENLVLAPGPFWVWLIKIVSLSHYP